VSAGLLATLLSVNHTAVAYAALPESSAAAEKKEVIEVSTTVKDIPLVEKYLLDGRLKEGEVALVARLKEHSSDDQARFGLGVLQFLRAVEGLGQAFTRYGVRTYRNHGFILPFLRLPAATNESSKTISYLKLREIVETFQRQLMQAESTLAPISDADVKLPLHFGMIKLDLNGTGQHGQTNQTQKSSQTDKSDQKASEQLPHVQSSDDNRSLWKVYAKLTNNSNIPIEKAEQFFIKFDRGDVHWLRGYCHLLSSVCDIYLAHDSKDLFERTAHLFFNKVDTPYQFLSKSRRIRSIGASDVEILDLVALIHLIRCEVIEPKRMASALDHLQAVIDQSRDTWKWIMAEEDDDHEWLPNPRQTGVIPNARVTEQMVLAWSGIMTESEKILSGELLIPFWRSSDNDHRGINLRKVFLQPQRFDLVLWVQGSAAAPYLEEGKLSRGQTWRDLRGEFGNHFPGFALWFN
jgi:hypothetical protein